MRLTVSRLWFLLVFAHPAFAEPQIPAPWRDYVRLDQGFNIGENQPLPESEREPIRVYHIDVPASDPLLSQYRSQFLDADTRKWVEARKNGRKHIRFFFVEKTGPLETFGKKYGPVKQQFWAVRLQSHSTHLMWDPSSDATLFIKVQQKDATTRVSSAQSAIDTNDFVERVFAQEPSALKTTYLPERFGATLGDAALEYTFTVRSTTPAGPPPSPNAKLVPLHGFLGSPELEKAAMARGLSTVAYLLDEYLPKLARYAAETNFRYGVYTEAHTQNLLAYIHPQTGEIESFVFRDMCDTAADPLIRLLSDKPPLTQSLRDSNTSILNRYHTSHHPKEKTTEFAYTAGWINGGFIAYHNLRAVFGDTDAPLQQFLKLFADEVEKLTGVELDRNGRRFYGPAKPSPSFPGRAAFQSIYEQVIARKLPSIQEASFDETVLRRIFNANYQSREVALVSPVFREIQAASQSVLRRYFHRGARSLVYTYQGGNIIAYNRRTHAPLAIAYALTPDEKEQAQAAAPRAKGAWSCAYDLLMRGIRGGR